MALGEFITRNLNAMELIILAAFSGAEVIQGLGDPFTGCLIDEIGEELGNAQFSLLERGIIKAHEEKIIISDDILDEMIRIFARSEVTVYVNPNLLDESSRIHVFHIYDNCAVMHDMPSRREEIIELIYMGQKEDMIDLLLENNKSLEGEIKSEGISSTGISREHFWKIISEIKENNARPEEVLGQVGISEEKEPKLYKLFASISQISSIVAVRESEDDWQIKGILILRGKENINAYIPDIDKETGDFTIIAPTMSELEGKLEKLIGIGD